MTKTNARKPQKDFVWNQDLAYAIGLITTDGSLSIDGRHVTFVSTDLQLLKEFQRCLPFDTKITNKLPSLIAVKKIYKIQFSNVQFYNWLSRIGLYPNKTSTIGAIKIPEEFFRDFLRGHLDGDGDICCYTDNYNVNPKYIYARLYLRFSSASKAHMVWLRNKISDTLMVEGKVYEQTDKRVGRSSIWRIRFAKSSSIKILSQLYYKDNVPCLKRKKNIFDNFMKTSPKQLMKQQASTSFPIS